MGLKLASADELKGLESNIDSFLKETKSNITKANKIPTKLKQLVKDADELSNLLKQHLQELPSKRSGLRRALNEFSANAKELGINPSSVKVYSRLSVKMKELESIEDTIGELFYEIKQAKG